MSTPFFALHGTLPSYHDLRAFGCTCYPNLSATSPHKLAPRSTLCAFLGYSPDHKVYQCLDLNTNCVIISRHVDFDETTFPFSLHRPSPPPQDLDFLTNDDTIPVCPLRAGTPGAAAPYQPVPLARVGMPASKAPVVAAPSTPAPPAVCRGPRRPLSSSRRPLYRHPLHRSSRLHPSSRSTAGALPSQLLRLRSLL
jgi:hypothetical protein